LDILGVRSYSVGITTLEEVFLKIGHGEEAEQKRADKELEDKGILVENDKMNINRLTTTDSQGNS